MKKSKLDLYLEASAAAQSSLDITGNYEVQAAERAAFDKKKNHPRDWDYFSETFNRLRAMFLTLRAEPAPSAIAPAKEASAPDAT